jgi:hypothetical protein
MGEVMPERKSFSQMFRERTAWLTDAGVGGAIREGEPPVLYDPEYLIVREEDAPEVGRRLGGALGDRILERGTRRMVKVGGDARERLRGFRDDGFDRGALHRVLTIAPNPHIGPGTDPELPTASEMIGPPIAADPAEIPPIAVVDTGQWAETFQPQMVLVQTIDEDPVDRATPPGVVDWYGSCHGGFIAGVIRNVTGGSSSAVRVISKSAFTGAFGGRPGASRDTPFGHPVITEESIVEAVDHVLDNPTGAKIVNLSLGTYRGDDAVDGSLELLEPAMDRWVDEHRDVLFVCAAGNDGWQHEFFPAAFAVDHPDRVVSVGATDHRDAATTRADFSNRGPWVNAWAPGVDVVSTYAGGLTFPDETGPREVSKNGLTMWSGTSFAAPFAAAEILRHAVAHTGGDTVAAWNDLRGDGAPVTFQPDW